MVEHPDSQRVHEIANVMRPLLEAMHCTMPEAYAAFQMLLVETATTVLTTLHNRPDLAHDFHQIMLAEVKDAALAAHLEALRLSTLQPKLDKSKMN